MARIKSFDEKRLTLTQFNELRAVQSNPFELAPKVLITHPMKGKVPFELYPYQKMCLYYFTTERFNMIKKFRQGGLTELIALYVYWFAMYRPNKSIQYISIKDRIAKKVLKRIKNMYRSTPRHLRLPIVNGKPGDYGTMEEIIFSNDSIITSLPTTEDAGRSEALSLLVLDEAAIIKWASTIWAAAFPTLSTGGSAIINSTPFGTGNWYHSTWVDAVAGLNGINAINLKWQMHPERDLNWYEEMKSILGPRRCAQEVDGDFLTSGNSVFSLLDIKAIEDEYNELERVEKRFNGSLLIFFKPIPGESYFIGADISTGRAKDYSAFTIMSSRGKEMGCFKGKVTPTVLSEILMKVGREYNLALIAPEVVGLGEAVVALLQRYNYPNLYHFEKLVKEAGKEPTMEKFPGWYTTPKLREIIITELEEDVRNELVEIYDPFFTSEAYTFIYNDRNKAIAYGKDKSTGEDNLFDEGLSYTDDAILGKAITNHIRKIRKNTSTTTPR